MRMVSHANHTDTDEQKVATTLAGAFTAHARGLERM